MLLPDVRSAMLDPPCSPAPSVGTAGFNPVPPGPRSADHPVPLAPGGGPEGNVVAVNGSCNGRRG
jgi:hypothetical protein